jgi:hypothetical protein
LADGNKDVRHFAAVVEHQGVNCIFKTGLEIRKEGKTNKLLHTLPSLATTKVALLFTSSPTSRDATLLPRAGRRLR